MRWGKERSKAKEMQSGDGVEGRMKREWYDGCRWWKVKGCEEREENTKKMLRMGAMENEKTGGGMRNMAEREMKKIKREREQDSRRKGRYVGLRIREGGKRKKEERDEGKGSEKR